MKHKSWYSRLRAFELYVVRVEQALTFVTLFGMVLCIGLGIVFRLTGISVPWTNEAAQIFLIWIMFIGANLGFYYSEHVGMTAFVDMLNRKGRYVFLLLVQICLIAFCLYTVIVGGWFVSFQRMMGGTTISLPFDLPKYVIAMVLPISFLAGLYHLVLQLFSLDEKLDAPEVLQAEGSVIPGQPLPGGERR